MATPLPNSSSGPQAPQNGRTATPGSDGAALGELLRHARERRGLTLQEISKDTKIPWRHLDALERGNLAAIPRGFYGRAEVRAYASAVNVDQKLALARLESALEAPAPRKAVPETPRTGARAVSRRQAVIALMAIGVVAAAVVLRLTTWEQRLVPAGGVQPGSPMLSQQPPGVPPVAHPGSDASVGTSGPVPIEQAPAPSADSSDEHGSNGELMVLTEPPGGRVTIDGIGWGITPVTIRHLTPGSKRIRVTKDGYAVEERVVSIGGNPSTVRLEIPLRSVP
jgi:transcriptional regulator with XRE-family HTH domain